MKRITLVILMLGVVFAGYAKGGKCKRRHMSARKIVSVGIRRTVCFGSCPEYSIEITKKGIITYTGKRFTKDTGIFEKNIGREAAKKIIDLYVQYRVDTCQDTYENMIPDLPGLIVTVNFKRCKKTIYNAGFGPKYLEFIASKVDAVGIKKDASWIKTGMPDLK